MNGIDPMDKTAKAIRIALAEVPKWTRQELEQYAFDKYVDELTKLNEVAIDLRYEEVRND